MKKIISLNAGTIIAITLSFYLVYYILLQDNFLHISIASIIASSHQMALRQHLLVLGLLPVYIALMIFGAVMLGIYLGPVLQLFISRKARSKQPLPSKLIS